MAFVQAGSAFNGGPVALTGVTAGNCLVAWICGTGSDMSASALPAGWVKQTQVANGSNMVGCWWVYPDHPGGTVSATITSAPTTCAWSAHEYSGRHLTAPVEDYSTNTGTSTTWSCPSVAVSEGADLVAAAGQPFTVFTITETVVAMTSRSAITNQVHASFSKDGMTAGTYSPGGAVSSASNPWIAASFGLAPPAGAPPDPPVLRLVTRAAGGIRNQ